MAAWQFDFNVVPRGGCWGDRGIRREDMRSPEFMGEGREVLPGEVMYGAYDGSCIYFCFENGILDDIRCRLDVRTAEYFGQLMCYIRETGGEVLYGGSTYPAEETVIKRLVRGSGAFRFCTDPYGYLREVGEVHF